MKYQVEIRCYTAGEDEDCTTEFDTPEAAYGFINAQRRFGPFRAWVNDREIKGAYHGVSLEYFEAELNLASLVETSAIAAKVIADLDAMIAGHRPARPVTNPATRAALEGIDRRLMTLNVDSNAVVRLS